MLTEIYTRVKCKDIKVNRENRQRRDLELDEGLAESIRRRGVINPIILTKDLELVAGERRLATSINLNIEDIPVRFLEDLPERERKIIELEENVKRADLTWQDKARSISDLYHLYKEEKANISHEEVANELGIVKSYVTMALRITPELENEKISSCTSITTAYNSLIRTDARISANAISSILEAGKNLFSSKPEEGPKEAPKPPVDSILNVDFLEWAPKYTGKTFNFIHCDFPYGIDHVSGGMRAGGQSTRAKFVSKYEDQEDIYWTLFECLADNLDRLMSYSGHLVFWFSMEYYEETLSFFRERLPSLEVNVFPLIWVKSDNQGYMPDARRGPRRIYETAFFASRADAAVVKPVSNAYSAPTDKLWHVSTKPEPMLHHFFQMFVDPTTRLLDPTCGSGSALRAAERLGAESVLGLEKDKESFNNAVTALRKFRALRGTR